MATKLKDFWTCGLFLSKEPYDELAIKCFICESLYYTIHDFQKHLADSHADEDEEETIRKPVLSQKCQLNNDDYLPLSEDSELASGIVNNKNFCDQDKETEILYENDFAKELEYPITERIVEPVTQTTAISSDTQPSKLKKHFKNRAAITKTIKKQKIKEGVMCDKCGLVFKDRSKLWHHLRIAHDKLRPFRCSECPRTYARKTHLSDHMRSHSQQRDFVCSICDKTFRRSQELTRHKLRHQTTKNYNCSRCDAQFRQHSGLYHHIKIKHSINNVMSDVVS